MKDKALLALYSALSLFMLVAFVVVSIKCWLVSVLLGLCVCGLSYMLPLVARKWFAVLAAAACNANTAKA